MGDGKWLLGINLVKISKACEKIAETSFRYPKLAFYKLFSLFLTYYATDYLENIFSPLILTKDVHTK